MEHTFLKIAAIFGILAVVLGAFGAHGLEGKLLPKQMETYETAVQYQFYHTFALLAVAILLSLGNGNVWLVRSGWFFVVGIIFFSGSLYLLACWDLIGLTAGLKKIVGPITPIGGFLFIIGWGMLFFGTTVRS